MVYDLIMPAAGTASRSGLSYSKLFYPIGDHVLLDYSLKPFLNDPECKKILLIINPKDKEHFAPYEKSEKIELVLGGESRGESVLNGLEKVKEKHVLIHDGARPFLSGQIIENVKKGLEKAEVSIASIPCRDTIKLKDNNTISTLDRSKLYQSQTPQGFKTETLKKAFAWKKSQDEREKNQEAEKIECSDEAQLMELFGSDIELVDGSSLNLKITDPGDFAFLRLLEP